MGSSGGGSSRPPEQPTPSGTITGYGAATPFNPSYKSVLSNGMGWADVNEVDAANAANASATIPTTTAASSSGSGTGITDAFAQRLMDTRKDPRWMAQVQATGGNLSPYQLNTMFGATTPAEQLMAQTVADSSAAVQRARLARMMGPNYGGSRR